MKTLNSRFKGNTLDLGLSVAVKTVGRPSVPGGSALGDTAMRHFRRSPRVLTCRNTPRTASPSGACAASTKLGYLSEFQWTTCSWKGGTRRDAGVIVQNSLEAEEQTQQRHRCAADARARARATRRSREPGQEPPLRSGPKTKAERGGRARGQPGCSDRQMGLPRMGLPHTPPAPPRLPRLPRPPPATVRGHGGPQRKAWKRPSW